VSFGEENWSEASLPIRHAGLGLRSTVDLSLPCFLSSSHACKGLINRLLFSFNPELPDGDVNDTIDACFEHHDSSSLQKGIQADRDDLACRDSFNTLLNTNKSLIYCQLLTAEDSHTAAWSEAFPLGNLLSPDELHCNSLPNRWQNLWKHKMLLQQICWDELRLYHGLSCTKNAGRFPRHSTINAILKRSLTYINLPSTLEPIGLNKWWEARWIDFGPLVQKPKFSMGCNSCGHFWSWPIQHTTKQVVFTDTKAEDAKC